MDRFNLPTSAVVTTSASIVIARDRPSVVAFVIDSDALPQWLQKYGPIHGVSHTVIERGPYNFVGARRKIHFDNGDSIIEELTSLNLPDTYTYRVTQFSNFFRFLTDAAHGECAFAEVAGGTQVTWNYAFTYRNFIARLFFTVFLPLVYRGFMNQCLRLAKGVLEHPAAKPREPAPSSSP